jgi:hypothetical protein
MRKCLNLRSACAAALCLLSTFSLLQASLPSPAKAQLSSTGPAILAHGLKIPEQVVSGSPRVALRGPERRRFEPKGFVEPKGFGHGGLSTPLLRRVPSGHLRLSNQLPRWPESQVGLGFTHGHVRGKVTKSTSLIKTAFGVVTPAPLAPTTGSAPVVVQTSVQAALSSSKALRGAPIRRSISASWPSIAETTTRDRFGRALIGSAIGAGLGVPLGALLIREARDEDSEFSGPNEGTDDETPNSVLRLGAGLLGVAFVGGSGPVGAVQRLGGRSTNTYVASIVGNLLGAAAGLSARQLGDSSRSKAIWGLAVGIPLAAIGAAAGAALSAEDGRSRASASWLGHDYGPGRQHSLGPEPARHCLPLSSHTCGSCARSSPARSISVGCEQGARVPGGLHLRPR